MDLDDSRQARSGLRSEEVLPRAEPEETGRRGAGEAESGGGETFVSEALAPGGLGGDGEDRRDAEGPGASQRVEGGLGVVALPGDAERALGGGGEPEVGRYRAGEACDVGA